MIWNGSRKAGETAQGSAPGADAQETVSGRRLRPQLPVLLVAAGLVVVLAAAAVVLAVTQSRAREGLTDRLQERTATMARFVHSTYAESFGDRPAAARAALAKGRTPAAALKAYVNAIGAEGSRFVIVDRAGAVVASLPGAPRPSERRTAHTAFVASARRSGWAVSGALMVDGRPEFAVAAHARTADGDFVFVDTGSLDLLQQFFRPLLAATPDTPHGAAALVDTGGRALSSTIGSLGGRVTGPLLGAATASRAEGRIDGARPARYAVVRVPGTTQRVLVTAPEAALLASASGATRWLPWLLLAALAGLGGVTVLLLLRGVRRTEELHAVSVAKTEFLAAASHELRTPLNGIIGFGQLLHDEKLGPIDEVQREALRDILSCSDHLLDVVTGLLDVTRAESGAIELHPEPVRIDQVMRDVAAGLTALAGATLVQIDVDVDPGLPEVVLLDPTRLRQVLFNYVSNALKHSAPGERVRMGARQDGAFVRFEVEDHGPGIAPDAIERLFTRYGRLPGSPDGTGLGLAVTRHIVEAHGGAVGVVSRPGSGATFWAKLPLVRVAPVPAPV